MLFGGGPVLCNGVCFLYPMALGPSPFTECTEVLSRLGTSDRACQMASSFDILIKEVPSPVSGTHPTLWERTVRVCEFPESGRSCRLFLFLVCIQTYSNVRIRNFHTLGVWLWCSYCSPSRAHLPSAINVRIKLL